MFGKNNNYAGKELAAMRQELAFDTMETIKERKDGKLSSKGKRVGMEGEESYQTFLSVWEQSRKDYHEYKLTESADSTLVTTCVAILTVANLLYPENPLQYITSIDAGQLRSRLNSVTIYDTLHYVVGIFDSLDDEQIHKGLVCATGILFNKQKDYVLIDLEYEIKKPYFPGEPYVDTSYEETRTAMEIANAEKDPIAWV